MCELCHPWDKYYRWGMELAKCFGYMAQMVKHLSTMWETWVWSLGWGDSLEKEMATHSSTLALKIPRTEELGVGYYPWGCKESGMTEHLHFLHFLSLLVRGRARIWTLVVKCMLFFFCGHAAHLSWTRIWTYALSSNESTSPNHLREVKVTQSCPTLCNPMDTPWNSPGQNTGLGSCSLLHGVFPTQGLNPGLSHCRWILYQLNHQEIP